MEVSSLSATSLKPSLPCYLRRAPASMRLSCLHYNANAREIGKLRARYEVSGMVDYSAKFSPTHIRRASHAASTKPCKATGEDSGQSPGSESTIVDEETLQSKLQLAIDEENYTEAAKIRDSLRSLHTDSKSSVLAANAQFYDAFRGGDLAAMRRLWAGGEGVCCVHPGAGGISGYDLVMSSWEYVWMDYDFPLEIELKDVQVRVKGDVGYVTCVELVRTRGSSWGRQFATNVFERIDGRWYITVHHGSPVDI